MKMEQNTKIMDQGYENYFSSMVAIEPVLKTGK